MSSLDNVEPSSALSTGFGASAEATTSSGENISDATDEIVSLDIERPSSA